MASPDTNSTAPIAKRPAKEFWALYRAYVNCTPDVLPELPTLTGDPTNAFEFGCADLDGLVPGQRIGDRFDLPPHVVDAWNAAMSAYLLFAELVENFTKIELGGYR